MRQPVVTCSEYEDKRTPSLWPLEKIAWRVSADKRKKTLGFVSPLEWKELVKAGKENDDDLAT